MPVYWKLLTAFPAEELILYRVLLSAAFLALFFFPSARRRAFLELWRSKRAMGGLALSGGLIGFNWYLYVWAVTNNHVVESSLGYFINPLMNVALGTLLLGERMNRAQTAACALAAAGVVILSWSTGLFPWIAFLLALSFALYGLTRKLLKSPTIAGTFVETILLAPACAVLLLWFPWPERHPGLTQWTVLLFSGVVTTIPLLAFAEAAKSLPLSVLGFFQFLSPSIQFLLGVYVYREPFSTSQWMSFLVIWSGLALFLADLARRRYRPRPLN